MGKPFSKSLTWSIVIILVVLTIQGLTGFYVSTNAMFPTSVSHSLTGMYKELQQAGNVALYHGLWVIVLLIFSILVLVLSFKTKILSVTVISILGLLALIIATLGGLLFVYSGFQTDAYSALMEYSFIVAWVLYLIEFYYAYVYHTS